MGNIFAAKIEQRNLSNMKHASKILRGENFTTKNSNVEEGGQVGLMAILCHPGCQTLMIKITKIVKYSGDKSE